MKRRLLKIGKWVLGIILVLAVVNGVSSVIMGRRYAAEVERIRAEGSPVSVLELGGPPVPEGENAAPLYKEVFRRIVTREGNRQLDILATVPEKDSVEQMWDPQWKTASLTSEQGKVLNSPSYWADAKRAAAYFADLRPKIELAVAKPACRFPIHWEQGYDCKLPHFAQLRNVERLLVGQASLQARDGQQEQALKTLNLAFKVANKTCDDPILIAVLVKCAMVKLANNALLGALRRRPMNADEAVAWNAVLQDTDYGRQYVQAMKGERALSIWGFDCVMRGGFGDVLKAIGADQVPNRFESKAIVFFARPVLYADGLASLGYLRKQIAVAAQPYGTGAQTRLDREIAKFPPYAVVSRCVMPVFSQIRARIDETRASTAITQIVLAAQQYKNRTGSYPTSIRELKAKTGWKLPDDPFSGSDFIYKPSGRGFVVYSIGRDMRDDGGVSGKAALSKNSAGLPVEGVPAGDIVLHWQ